MLRSAGVDLVVAACRSSAEVAAAGREADALLVNMAKVDSAAIESLVRCRVISRYGIGLDNIDLDAAARRGIEVANVPGYCDNEVAEHALGLILSCARAIPRRDRAIREGGWNVAAPGAPDRGQRARHPGLRRHGQGPRSRLPRPRLQGDPRVEPSDQRGEDPRGLRRRCGRLGRSREARPFDEIFSFPIGCLSTFR